MKNNEYLKMIFLLIKKYKIHFLFVFSLIIALSEFVLAIKMDVLISALSLGEKIFFHCRNTCNFMYNNRKVKISTWKED